LASNQGAAAYRVTGRQQGLVVCFDSGIYWPMVKLVPLR
jgi:hypothetical protein